MKPFRLLATVSAFLLLAAAARAGWMRDYGGEGDDYGAYVEQTRDSGYILIANTHSPETKEDIWVIKTDAQGDTLWTKRYGGPEDDWATSGQVTSDGGYVVTGVTTSFGKGDYDVWLLRMDAQGDTLWTRIFGDSAYEAANFVSQTWDGGFVIAGYRDGELNEQYGLVEPGDIWLIKVTATGNLTWNKRYGRKDESDEAYCVRQTSDSGYIMGCYAFYKTTTESYARLMRTNSNGDSLWTYRTPNDRRYNWVEETSDGGYVACGNFEVNAGIARFGENGGLLWEKLYGDSGAVCDRANCFRETPDGGYILTGLHAALFSGEKPMNGDLWLLKTDGNGDTAWTHVYGSNPQYDYGNCVALTSDGGYVITGLTGTYTSGGYDVWLIKTDSQGRIGVGEKPVAEEHLDFEIVSPIGSRIVLRFADSPQGFHTDIFDAAGRQVDELTSSNQAGILIWGEGQNPGVYFIVSNTGDAKASKVILIK